MKEAEMMSKAFRPALSISKVPMSVETTCTRPTIIEDNDADTVLPAS